jgi:hypothetical protein
MMDDDRLQALLHSALQPVADRDPSRDLWPLVLTHVETREGWPWLDISLASAVAAALLMFPGGLLLLAYHL